MQVAHEKQVAPRRTAISSPRASGGTSGPPITEHGPIPCPRPGRFSLVLPLLVLPLLAAVLLAAAGCESSGDGSALPPQASAAEGRPDASPAEVLSPSADTSAGWPNLFGPTHDSVSAELGVRTEWPKEGPPVQWIREVGTGYSSPIIRGRRLVLLHRLEDREDVECFDAESGETLWTYSYPTGYVNKYHFSHGPYSTPAMDDRHVYAVSAEGQVHCVRVEDGSPVWQRPLYEEYKLELGSFAVAASPLLEGDQLIFNLGAGSEQAGIIALDKASGETRWTATDHGASCATPVAADILGRRYLFVVTYEGLVALEAGTGKVLWSVEHRPKAPDSINATSPLVVGDRVIMVTGPGPGALCLRVLPDGGYEEVWRDRRVLDSQFNNLVAVDGHLYGYSSKRQDGSTFRCVRLEDGELCWKWSSPLARGCVLAVDGHFLLWGEHGHLASLRIDPEQPRVRALTAEPLLETPCYSSPALQNGLLYVRNESRLLCLNLRGGARETVEPVRVGRASGADRVPGAMPTR